MRRSAAGNLAERQHLKKPIFRKKNSFVVKSGKFLGWFSIVRTVMWPRLESFGRGVAEQKKQTKMNIARKIALVTGGSRGLGRDIALALARNGADVILTYRQRKGKDEATAAEIEQLGRKAALLQIDVADISRFDRFAKAVQQALEETWQRKLRFPCQ